MRFRPCIDIHDGRVKQIVGGSLRDKKGLTRENFVSDRNAEYFAELYKRDGLRGGHIILLNPCKTPEYERDIMQAKAALSVYPGGFQLGGGITDQNAEEMLDMGASHIIVTSYVFHDGIMDIKRLEKLCSTVGKDRLVLDLSCRKMENDYYIVTDRWQKFTREKLTVELLDMLSGSCEEYLIHGVDVEGRKSGIESELVSLLKNHRKNPITYAGGVSQVNDIELIDTLGEGRIDFTVGSALDLFGGTMPYKDIVKKYGVSA